jgi:uncharacterized membrane protein
MFGGTDSETGSAFGDGDFSAPPQLSDAEVRTIVAGWQVGQKFYVSFCTIDNPEPVLWTGQVIRRVGGLALNVEESTPLRLKVRYAQAPHSFWMPPDEGVIILGLGAGRPPFAPAAAAPAKIAPGKAGAKAAPAAQAAKAPVPVPARAPRTAQQREEDAEILFGRIADGVELMAQQVRLSNTLLSASVREAEAKKKKSKKEASPFCDPREWRFHLFNETDELLGDSEVVVAQFLSVMATHFETHSSHWRGWALGQVREELDAICRWGATAFEDDHLMTRAGRALWRLRSVTDIERHKLAATGDTPAARGARAAMLQKLMATFEADVAVGVDELDVAVQKLIAAEAGKKPLAKPGAKNGAGGRNCYNCGKKGHISADCPEPAQDGDRKQQSGNGSGVQRK